MENNNNSHSFPHRSLRGPKGLLFGVIVGDPVQEKMQRSLEQRMAIKFCVKLEKSAAETIPMLKKVFGVDCLSDRQIFRWHKAFAEGLEDVNDENRPQFQSFK
ncbi:hypothetical protein NQ318_017167 [Aromia moschata]|uniref:Mos1 transposase HTH domain-containing protein n=1 Tax=Aromia moschata TaxID=1265417 RepID=A0AAV8YP06_9CUCU|nr:hypothetical protein NQ318_017167 [Aromia moschata]